MVFKFYLENIHYKKVIWLSTVVHAYNLSTWEGGRRILSSVQPALHSETVFKNLKKKKFYNPYSAT
jgi:hypothetical protein